MARLPDLKGDSFDELQALLSAANKRMDDIRAKRVKELQTELTRLGGGDGASVSRRGRRSAATRPGTRAAQKATAGRAVPVQFRGPNGEEYSGRGAIPRWARESRRQRSCRPGAVPNKVIQRQRPGGRRAFANLANPPRLASSPAEAGSCPLRNVTPERP